MEEDRKLYPFRFQPLEDRFSWGSLTFSVADLGYRDSVIRNGWLAGTSLSELMEMYMDRVVGDRLFSFFGRQFPLGISLMDVRGRTPLVVHPDDGLSFERYDSLGKSKFWYVLGARDDARLFLGFKSDTDASALCQACLGGDPEQLLNAVRVKKGDCFVIEPGTVHAAQGVLLLEISEASQMDFCLCDWGCDTGEQFDPSFDLASSLDFINYRRYKAVREDYPLGQVSQIITSRKEFTVSRMELSNTVRISSDEPSGFALYTCVAGELIVIVNEEDERKTYPLKAGDSILVPADILEYYLEPLVSGTVLLEAVTEPVEETDSYIDPEAEAYPKGARQDSCEEEAGGFSAGIGDRLWRIR